MKRRELLQFGAGASIAGFSTYSAAQPKTLTIVVGYGAGSSLDLGARRSAERLGTLLKRSVIVDNKPGAGGQIALAALNSSAGADGSLIAFTAPAPITLFPLTYDRLPYMAKDFVPMGAPCTVEGGLVVGANHPSMTMLDFIEWAKANPCSIGNPGHATGPHFNVWQLARAAKIDVQHVPYKSIPQLATDIVAGHVNAGYSAIPAFVELIKAGRLRLLATAGTKRSALFPQVPTFVELGYKDVHAEDWYGFVASARASQQFRAEFEDALRSICKEPGYRNALSELGLIPQFLDTSTLTERIKSDAGKWVELVKVTGYKASST